MKTYKHFCPYCLTELSINESEQERYAAKCPKCSNVIVVKEHGQNLSKPFIYKCPKCGQKHMYYEQITGLVCDNCQSILFASEKGTCLIDPILLQKGDSGELPYVKKVDKKVKLINNWLVMPSGTKVGIIGGVILFFAVITFIWYILKPSAIESTMAYSNEYELWEEFREKNPINYQTVGIKAYEDNSYNVILSEPSPSISIKKLETFIKKYNGVVITHECPMGIDGWLKDAVLCFNGIKSSKIERFKSSLFNLLYGTDYKASFENFSEIIGHTNYIKENTNYQISAEELQQWFITDRQLLISAESNEEFFLETLLSEDKTGIYYSKAPGTVIWIICRQENNPSNFDVPARMFALDTDMILGAIGMGNSVAIIGRERELSLHELPPMRIETMKLLASTKKEELSQSYERNNIVAGKMSDGKDFAPILLSPELWHTEYGSILNVTDQMLKSWSENGEIEYETFLYPKPFEWAFIESAMRDLRVSELTYNWNTSGAGYSIEGGDNNPYSIYAINRTGSLPVSYIPGSTDKIAEDDTVYQAEENAYDFFSGLASPELIKVVQYASLYQIFMHYDYHLQFEPETYVIKTNEAEYTIKTALNRISNFGEPEKEILRSHVKQTFLEYEDEINKLKSIPERKRTKIQNSRYLQLLFFNLFVDREEVVRKRIAEFDSLKTEIKTFDDYRLNDKVSHYLVNPRDIDYISTSQILSGDNNSDITNDEAAQCYALMLLNDVEKIKHYNQIFHVFDLKKLRDSYIEENQDVHSNWIKCPTVVQSWNARDSINSIGGHNLNSHITPVKIDNTLRTGQCVVEKMPDGSKVIKISPLDKGQITPSFLRNVERTGKIGNHNFKTSARNPRLYSEVFPTNSKTFRGFDPATQVSRVIRENNGFSINGKLTSNVDTFWKELAASPKEENAPIHQIIFENFSQDEVRMIMDGNPAVIINKGEASRSLMSEFDFGHMKVSEADVNGNVIVTIPKKSKNLIIGEGDKKQVIPIRSASLEIQFPIQSKNGWLKTIRQMFVDPDTGEWSFFRFKRAGKKNGLNPDETKELIRYQFANNHNLYQSYSLTDVFFIQPQIA